MFNTTSTDNNSPSNLQPINQDHQVMTKEQGKGLAIRAIYFVQGNGSLAMRITFYNHTPKPLSSYALKFNQNIYGVAPVKASLQCGPCAAVSNGQPGRVTCVVPIAVSGNGSGNPNGMVQIAVKTDLGIAYFQHAPFVLFTPDSAKMDKKAFLGLWGSIPDTKEQKVNIQRINSSYASAERLTQYLKPYHVHYLACRNVPNKGEVCYYALQLMKETYLVELVLRGDGGAAVCIRTNSSSFGRVVLQTFNQLLSA